MINRVGRQFYVNGKLVDKKYCPGEDELASRAFPKHENKEQPTSYHINESWSDIGKSMLDAQQSAAPNKYCWDDFSHLVFDCAEDAEEQRNYVRVSFKDTEQDIKPRPSLLPFNALTEVIKVLEFGAKKHSVDNWKEMDNAKAEHQDAMLRHILAHMSGEHFDKETGLSHLTHAISRAMFIRELSYIPKEI